jgi:hypothetical protein
MKKLLKASYIYRIANEWYPAKTGTAIIAQEDLDRARASGGKIVRLPTYQPDGEKTSHMLDRLTPGLYAAYEAKHGYTQMIHLCYLENAIFTPHTPVASKRQRMLAA